MKILFFIHCLYYLLFFSPSIHNGNSQTGLVSGFVKDEDGNPLYGASVRIKENNSWAVTDMNGFYNLRLPRGKFTLIISSYKHLTRLAKIKVVNGAVIKKDFVAPGINKEFGETTMLNVHENMHKSLHSEPLITKQDTGLIIHNR